MNFKLIFSGFVSLCKITASLVYLFLIRILCVLVSVVFLCTSLVIWTYLFLSEMYKIVGREIARPRILASVKCGVFWFGCGFLGFVFLQSTFFLADVTGHKKRSSNTAFNISFAWLHKKLCLQPEKRVSIGLLLRRKYIIFVWWLYQCWNNSSIF